jgi:hypothetical protein
MEQQHTDERLSKIEACISSIIERNHKVEIEKAWEISKTRIISIVILTYALMTLIFSIIGVENYFINAIIPTLGYFLSTQSLPLIKKKWLSRKFPLPISFINNHKNEYK